jgi:hypothetical protein
MKIYKSSSQNYKNKARSSPAIKYNAKYKYDNIFKFFWNQIVGKYKCWQEKKDEKNTAKNHKN